MTANAGEKVTLFIYSVEKKNDLHLFENLKNNNNVKH